MRLRFCFLSTDGDACQEARNGIFPLQETSVDKDGNYEKSEDAFHGQRLI